MNDARLWDRLASRHDIIVRFFDTSYERVRERLPRDLPVGGRILEVGAGTGQFTQELAHVAGDLLATDVSPRMLERLRERVAEAALSSTECVVMTAYELDVLDQSVDALLCQCAARHGRPDACPRRVPPRAS